MKRAVFKRIDILNLRQMKIRRYTPKSINLFLQVCHLPGRHESDILHRTLPGAWIPMAGLYQISVRLLEQSAPPTFCLRFLGKTLKLSLPTVLSRDLPSDSFYGNLSYYCYRKLVSVSVDGRCKYLTPRRQHMFAWRGWISSSRFMFTNYTVIHELKLHVDVIVCLNRNKHILYALRNE